MGLEMRMDPRSNRIVTPGSMELRVMLQLRDACTLSFAAEKVRVKTVLLSTGVRGVLSIEPTTFVGLVCSLSGCSYRAKIACREVRSGWRIDHVITIWLPRKEDMDL